MHNSLQNQIITNLMIFFSKEKETSYNNLLNKIICCIYYFIFK